MWKGFLLFVGSGGALVIGADVGGGSTSDTTVGGGGSIISWDVVGVGISSGNGSTLVKAGGNASVVAGENTSVMAGGSPSVVAGENTSVMAGGSSSVISGGNVSNGGDVGGSTSVVRGRA